MEKYFDILKELVMAYAPQVIYALVLLVVGLFVINVLTKTTKKVMEKRGVEITLRKFIGNLLSWALKALLIVAVISKLGIETTSFAAILAAAGLAVGLALQGSLSNFAGGALIMIFKPFKVGDVIQAQGETGKVKEIQIFTTLLNTPQNRLVIIPNGALSNGNIVNFTAEGVLRVDLVIGVSYDADIKKTKDVLTKVVNDNPMVLSDLAPAIRVLELADSSVNFAVRPWAKTEDYWDVYHDLTEAIKLALDEADIEIPYPHVVEIHKQG